MSIAEQVAQLKQDFDKVYEAGKQAGEGAIWSGLQNNGIRKNYSRAFFTVSKLDDWFYPKYDFNISASAAEMFRGATCSGDFDMAKRLEECGVTMDFTGCNNLQLAFAYFPVKRLPEINVTGITTASGITQTFAGCYKLEHLTLAGTLSVNSLTLSDCTKLSKASITSVINALSPTTSGLSVTLSETAVNNAFANGDTLGMDSAEWGELIETKSNWTINLV